MKRFIPLPASAAEPARDRALDGLRGSCALLVLSAHIFYPTQWVDPVWAPPRWTLWFDLGYPAVLLFFVLSGYVIGLTVRAPATPGKVGSYVVHRVARLWPTVFIAVLVTVVLYPAPSPLRATLGNLFFLQNFQPYPWIGSFPIFPNNPNLWSLNYEAVYYLGFIFLWRGRWPVWPVILAAILVAWSRPFGMPEIFSRYAIGSFYWLAGLSIAWFCPADADPSTRRNEWPAAVLSFYALWAAAPLRTLFLKLEWYNQLWPTPMAPHRIDMMLACTWVVLAVTNRAPRARKILGAVCLTWIALGLGAHMLSDFHGGLVVAAIAWAAAVWLVRKSYSLRPLAALGGAGGIAFGLYVIASPLQMGQRLLFPSFAGSPCTFWIRALVLAIGALTAAWLLERIFARRASRLIFSLTKAERKLT